MLLAITQGTTELCAGVSATGFVSEGVDFNGDHAFDIFALIHATEISSLDRYTITNTLSFTIERIHQSVSHAFDYRCQNTQNRTGKYHLTMSATEGGVDYQWRMRDAAWKTVGSNKQEGVRTWTTYQVIGGNIELTTSADADGVEDDIDGGAFTDGASTEDDYDGGAFDDVVALTADLDGGSF